MKLATSGARVLVTQEEIATRVRDLGADIAAAYPPESPPLLVAVLKGSTMFLADLVRAMPVGLSVDFMSISSYGDSPSGVARIVKDLEQDIVGRHVVLVEDIVDTGLTLSYLTRTLAQRGPRSVRTVTLLDKVARRIVPVEVEYVGFEIPDVFVVGYGLDFHGLYRNLPDLLAVGDLAALARRPDSLVDELFAPP